MRSFEKASKRELKKRASDCLLRHDEAGGFDKTHLLLQAQLYLQELDRRYDSFISIRDFILELIVILLIGGEIYLGWKQASDEAAMMNKQDGILTNLQKSTEATAKLVQQQLDLEYLLAINVEYDGRGTLAVYNNSRSQVMFAGAKIGRTTAKIRTSGQKLIPDHNFLPLSIAAYNPNLLQTIMRANVEQTTFPVELYISNALGQEYIWKGELTSGRLSGNTAGVPGGILVREGWSQNVRIVAIP